MDGMNDLLKKLNVLVKASLNDKISGVTGSGDNTARRPSKTTAAMDDDIAGLWQRINEAVEYEDEIQARIRQFEDEAARWDSQADDAVTQGNDVNARYAIEQMKLAERRAELARSDLREHQQATQELIQRVNTLEAVVADAKAQAEQAKAASASSETTQSESATSEDAQANTQANLRIPDLSNVLRDARDKITSLSETAAQRADQDLSTSTTVSESPAETPQDKAAVDDDLERRRGRLSKR